LTYASYPFSGTVNGKDVEILTLRLFKKRPLISLFYIVLHPVQLAGFPACVFIWIPVPFQDVSIIVIIVSYFKIKPMEYLPSPGIFIVCSDVRTSVKPFIQFNAISSMSTLGIGGTE